MPSPFRAALVALALAASCGGHSAPPDGGDASPDAAIAALDLSGKFASRLTLTWRVAGSDGGAPAQPLELLAAWTALDQQPGPGTSEVDTSWELCAASLPGLGAVPFAELAPVMPSSRSATATGSGPTTFDQPPLAFVLGAQLADPLHDPLPGASARVCASAADTGCLVAQTLGGPPGAFLYASGLDPDVDVIYLAARVTFALHATAAADGSLDGDVTSAAIEASLVGCHLRAGADCAPSDLARLVAAQPRVEVTGGKLRSFSQGPYFTCPLFLANPALALSGTENQPAGGDGGLGGASADSISFSSTIQRDLDARGCATGGCHELSSSSAWRRMPLLFAPTSDADRRANYRAVLPFTVGDAPRLVEQTPLPDDVRARWLAWIADGAPF